MKKTIILSLILAFALTNVSDADDPNLVGWWKFDGDANDYSGYDNHGTIIGDPNWVTGQISGALDFDGVDDYIDCGSNNSLDVTDAITIGAWVKCPNFTTTRLIAGKTNGNFLDAGYGLFSYEEGVEFVFYSGGWRRTTPRVPITPNQWHYVAATFDGNNAYLYVDGEQNASSEHLGTITTATGYPFHISFWRPSYPAYFNGTIDDVRIYDRALLPEEVEAIYGSGFSEPVIRVSTEWFEFLAEEGGANPADQILDIRNVGPNTLNWEISADCNWLTADPNTGSSSGDVNEVTLSVDTAGLSKGIYDCNLTISDPCAVNSPLTVMVNLIVGPVIELSATEFEFTAIVDGANPADQILSIRNDGGGTLNWQITYDCNWLTVDPVSDSSTGEPNDVTLSVDISGLAVGTYDCNLTISDPCAVNSLLTVPVWLILECYTGLEYNDWVEVGRPECWCSSYRPRQCHGDADGKSEGKGQYWVFVQDLNVMLEAWGKGYYELIDANDNYLTYHTASGDDIPLICADFNHQPETKGEYRVFVQDLNILLANWGAAFVEPNCP